MTTRKGKRIAAEKAHRWTIRPMFNTTTETRAWDAGYASGVVDTVRSLGVDAEVVKRCEEQLARLVTPEVDCG